MNVSIKLMDFPDSDAQCCDHTACTVVDSIHCKCFVVLLDATQNTQQVKLLPFKDAYSTIW